MALSQRKQREPYVFAHSANFKYARVFGMSVAFPSIGNGLGPGGNEGCFLNIGESRYRYRGRPGVERAEIGEDTFIAFLNDLNLVSLCAADQSLTRFLTSCPRPGTLFCGNGYVMTAAGLCLSNPFFRNSLCSLNMPKKNQAEQRKVEYFCLLGDKGSKYFIMMCS